MSDEELPDADDASADLNPDRESDESTIMKSSSPPQDAEMHKTPAWIDQNPWSHVSIKANVISEVETDTARLTPPAKLVVGTVGVNKEKKGPLDLGIHPAQGGLS